MIFLSLSFPLLDCWKNQAALENWNYLNDPVLLSYWWCLLNDVLFVKRRIPSASSPGCSSPSHHNFSVASPIPHTTWSNGLSTLSKAKELWIFWYGDTPQDLCCLVVPYILNMECELGSWENRSLLIKAPYNLIERSVRKFSPFFI